MTRVWWMPPNGALHGWAIDRLMWINLVALGACLVLAHMLMFAALLRRNRANQPPSRLRTSGLFRWEVLPLFAFCALYAWLAITAQRLWAANRFEGPSPSAMQIEVVGVQFQWYFRYPGPDAAFGQTRPGLVDAANGNPLGLDPRDPHSADDFVSSVLVVPAGREIDLRLRAQDVIHGFFIPGMRLKQNAVPGMVLHLHFTPQVPGTYPILCSQVCGLGHARMQAALKVVSASHYRIWLAAQMHLPLTRN